MFALLPTLLPILLVDMLNPVLIAVLVFAAGSSRPVVNSSAILIGRTRRRQSRIVLFGLADTQRLR